MSISRTERNAVEVNYHNQTFYLDNETGSAWLKVTKGGGGPEWGHKSLPDDSEVIKEVVLRDLTSALVIQDNNEPIAVIVSYEMFLRMQSEIGVGP